MHKARNISNFFSSPNKFQKSAAGAKKTNYVKLKCNAEMIEIGGRVGVSVVAKVLMGRRQAIVALNFHAPVLVTVVWM